MFQFTDLVGFSRIHTAVKILIEVSSVGMTKYVMEEGVKTYGNSSEEKSRSSSLVWAECKNRSLVTESSNEASS